MSSTDSKCRTCFNAAKILNPLTEKTRDYKKRVISFGELLEKVIKININNYKCQKLPQFICGSCSRRLKSAYAFIQQAAEVNDKLFSMINEKFDCLEETQIDLEPYIEVKFESTAQNEKLKKADSLQREEIYVQSCTEIVVESNKAEQKIPNFEFSQETQRQFFESAKETKEKIKQIQNNKNNIFNNLENIRTEAEIANYNLQTCGVVTKLTLNKDYYQSLSTQSDSSECKSDVLITSKIEISEETEKGYDIAVTCDICNKIFKNSKLLTVHQRISHVPEEKKCTCYLCGNKFTRCCNMYKHMRTFHGPETVKLIYKRPECAYIYNCDKCPKKYSRRKNLLYHIKLKHSPTKQVTENKTNIEHRKSTDKGSLCPICGSSFTSKNQLTIHLRRHAGEKPFKCDLCDGAFLLVTQLNNHKRLHTGEKPYKCQLCEKFFRVSDDLRQHMRTHSNLRPHKCSQCVRSFKHSQDLKIHLRSHTGERPYCCAVCGDSFQRYNTLRSHRNRMGHFENLLPNGNK